MFYGDDNRKIDNKGRLQLPSKHRSQFSDNFAYVVRDIGEDKCLHVFTVESWEKEQRNSFREATVLVPNKDVSKERRETIYSNVETVKIDKAGRIRLIEKHLAYAGIEDEVSIRSNGVSLILRSMKNYKKICKD